MRLYLDSSVLVKLFKIESGSDGIVKIIAAMDKEQDWLGYTSRWSTLEIARA